VTSRIQRYPLNKGCLE